MFKNNIPIHRISKPSDDDIKRLKTTKILDFNIDIKEYLFKFLAPDDSEHLDFDFEEFYNKETNLIKLNSSLQRKEISDFNFHDYINIYSNIERQIIQLKHINFNKYFAENSLYYERSLLNNYFNKLNLENKYSYIYVLLLYVDMYYQPNVLYKNSMYIKRADEKNYTNIRLLKYIIKNYYNIKLTEILRIRKTLDNEIIEINIYNTKKEVNYKIAQVLKKNTLKLKNNEKKRREQIKLMLIILYSSKYKLSKKETLKKSIQYGYKYILDDEYIYKQNMNEDYVDYDRILKNNRLFNETYNIIKKYLQESPINPF